MYTSIATCAAMMCFCCHALLQESGHKFTVRGSPRNYRGTLALVSADNPASCALGGFKESSSAYRHCRQCMGTKEEMRIEVFVFSFFTINMQ